MGQPVVSISVPEGKKDVFKESIPILMAHAGTSERSMKFSTFVQKVVMDGVIYSSQELQKIASKEALTTRDKYLLVILD